jgi:uncharacterized membrane protein
MEKLLSNPFTVTAGLVGIIYLIVGIIMTIYPPKNINSMYGYRTPKSMKSPQAWAFAQKYSTKLFLIISILLITIAAISSQFTVTEEQGIVGGIGAILLLTFFLIFKTETELKKRLR